MKLKKYQEEAARTCPTLGSIAKDSQHMNLGIITEIAEILDVVKKHNAYGKEIDIVNIGEEIGDLCWYVANKLRMDGVKLTDEMPHKPDAPSLKQFLEIDPGNFLSYISLILTNDEPTNYLHLITYAMEIASVFELNFEDILEKNINKLRVRYPEKFDAEKAINRNLEEERKQLNG